MKSCIKKNTSSQALYYNMAHVYKKMQRYDKAIELYQYILKEAPSFYQAHLALAQAYLYTKNFYQGFKELAFSVKNHLVEKPLLTQLSDAKNKTVLITTSWDAQDMVQLIQFIPLLKQAGAHILLHVDEKLAPLFKTSPFIDQVITTSNTQIPYFDTHISMLALPALCVTAANALPSFTFPFIIPAHLVKQWHKKIHIHGSHSVGLFWNTYTHCDNILESNTIPFSSFTTILENASFNCYALQPVSSQEASIIPCHGRITMLSPDLCPEKDILEFCALLSALDIIITCDSITAHLAGALGKPTLLIVPPIYQWRWIAQEQHSVFYPSAHIIQTNHTNDEQLKAEIVGYLGKYSSIHNCDTIE